MTGVSGTIGTLAMALVQVFMTLLLETKICEFCFVLPLIKVHKLMQLPPTVAGVLLMDKYGSRPLLLVSDQTNL